MVKIDKSYDIPYVAGYSEDGKTVYIDRHFNPKMDGHDVTKYIVFHEVGEKKLLQKGMDYQHAHHEITKHEKTKVEAAGLDWKKYSSFVGGQAKEIEHERVTKVPHDLDMEPYKDMKDYETLRKLRGAKVNEDYAATLRYHSRLNPKVWNSNNKLKPEVRVKLLQFAKTWQQFAEIPQSAVVDVILTGGNANYNYTPYSDLDVHVVVDKTKLKQFGPKIDTFMQAKKQLWTLTHKISVLGYPLEPYAQDSTSKYPANQGVYSLKNDRWVQEPKFVTGMDFKNNIHLRQKVEYYMNLIDDVIKHKAGQSAVDAIKNRIKTMRAAAIAQGGEFSLENLVFKELRNQGYLDKLNDYEKSKQDKKLSL